MTNLGCESLVNYDLGDKRLTARAVSIQALSVAYGQALSMVFKSSDLKRATIFANPKTSFRKLTQPHHSQTIQEICPLPVVLAVDTSYLDYKISWQKREEYGPIGKGGNGLILHSTLAVNSGVDSH